jgi:hypothetical protein
MTPYARLGKDASLDAVRRAAAILEVLAGERTAADAAAVLKLSVHRYYVLEHKALGGLVAACEPEVKGPRAPTTEKQLVSLQRELAHCQRQCMRQAALVRATQRAVGLPAAASKAACKQSAAKAGKKNKDRRRGTVRALRAAQRLRENSSGSQACGELEPAPREETEGASPVADKERQGGAQR